MQRYAAEMGEQIGERAMLVEYGSGSSTKTRILLDHLPHAVAYVPVDISREHLFEVSRQLQQDYPGIEVLPIAADFTSPFRLPNPQTRPEHTTVYFPGSTIGNFKSRQAERLLRSVAVLSSPCGGLLIGIDLEKEVRTLELAYDDPAGVTAQFNLNLLHRMRNELGAEIDIGSFEHVARYNRPYSRIDIFIRSICDQTIVIDDEVVHCGAGELIHTEYSHKYTIARFAKLAARAGLALRGSWTDARQYFAVLNFVVEL
jgi:dimethylhistidine N-methyltransferase